MKTGGRLSRKKRSVHGFAPTNPIYEITCSPDTHYRYSICMKYYDYSQAGAYFETICACQREFHSGHIVDGGMVLNDIGRIVVVDEWERTPDVL